MEWSWRTVLILLGLFMVIAIVVDGFRRMRRARAEALRLDVEPGLGRFGEDLRNPELPSSFRVIKPSAPASEHNRYASLDERLYGVDDNDDDLDAKQQFELDSALAFENDDYSAVQYQSQAHAFAATKAAVTTERAPKAVVNAETERSNAATTAKVAPQPELKEPAFDAADFDIPDFDEPQLDDIDEHKVDDRIIPWEDELGEARVVDNHLTNVVEPIRHSPVQDLEIPPSRLIPKARPVNLDEQVPVLLDVEELGADDVQPVVTVEDIEQAIEEVEAELDAEEKQAEQGEHASVYTPIIASAALEEALAHTPDMEEELAEIPTPIPLYPVNLADINAEKLDDRPEAEIVLEIHCIARDPQGFSGKDIIFLFNSCDLRFGEKQIFHRFELPDSKGCIQFSVAQSFNPGIFAPSAMPNQHFRGLSFFMSLPGAKKPLEAYDAMSGMAMVLARKLNAELYDGARSALTHQTIEHDRQTIMEFERRRQVAAKKHARF